MSAQTATYSTTIVIPSTGEHLYLGPAQHAILVNLTEHGPAQDLGELIDRLGIANTRHQRDDLNKRIARLVDDDLVYRDYPIPEAAQLSNAKMTGIFATDKATEILLCSSCNRRAKYLTINRMPACHTHAARLTMFGGLQ